MNPMEKAIQPIVADLFLMSIRFEQNEFEDTLYELNKIKRKLNKIIDIVGSKIE